MAKARAARLKVFQAQFGFYDSVVAAPSQAAALRAWGTHQNLFADGLAKPADDAAAIEAALAHAGVPLQRAVGSTGAYEVEPTSLPVLPEVPKGAVGKRRSGHAKHSGRNKPAPDRSRLDMAERNLRDLDAAWAETETDYQTRLAALWDEMDQAKRAYETRRSKAASAAKAEREAYCEAGGALD